MLQKLINKQGLDPKEIDQLKRICAQDRLELFNTGDNYVVIKNDVAYELHKNAVEGTVVKRNDTIKKLFDRGTFEIYIPRDKTGEITFDLNECKITGVDGLNGLAVDTTKKLKYTIPNSLDKFNEGTIEVEYELSETTFKRKYHYVISSGKAIDEITKSHKLLLIPTIFAKDSTLEFNIPVIEGYEPELKNADEELPLTGNKLNKTVVSTATSKKPYRVIYKATSGTKTLPTSRYITIIDSLGSIQAPKKDPKVLSYNDHKIRLVLRGEDSAGKELDTLDNFVSVDLNESPYKNLHLHAVVVNGIPQLLHNDQLKDAILSLQKGGKIEVITDLKKLPGSPKLLYKGKWGKGGEVEFFLDLTGFGVPGWKEDLHDQDVATYFKGGNPKITSTDNPPVGSKLSEIVGKIKQEYLTTGVKSYKFKYDK